MKKLRGLGVATLAVAAAQAGFFCTAAHAQFAGGAIISGVEVVPTVGTDQSYDPTNGRGEIQTETGAKSRLIIRPAIPSKQAFSTTFDYESWGNESKGDVTRLRGSRISAIFGYTHGLRGNAEVSLMVPQQRVELDGYGHGYGLGDIMAVYRKYSFDEENPDKPTFVYSLRAFAPTGDEDKGLGIGKFSGGPQISVSKPFGEKTLGYAGASYTFARGRVNGVDLNDLVGVWVGGVTQFKSNLGLQYELSYLNSLTDETFVRVLVGPRYSLSPTKTIQLNLRQELKAAGNPRSISIGFNSQF